MPPIRQKRSIEDQLADALRRIEALELKLDRSKQRDSGGDGLWTLLDGVLQPTEDLGYSEFFVGPDAAGAIDLDDYGALILSPADAYIAVGAEDGVYSEAFLAVERLAAGVDGLNWSKATFYTQSNDAQNIWDGMVSPTVSADLDQSQFGFWFDATPGSASINWVAKDSAGTVVTGSTPLT